MSYLLFMDESGHDGSTPYEVRGGIALPDAQVWPFTRRMRGLESRCYGTLLKQHGSEIKAVKLLQRRRLRLARLQANYADEERQALCLDYLGQGRNGQNPSLEMAVAYAQAGSLFIGKLLDLIRVHHGRIFASIVPSGYLHPPSGIPQNFVRKDITYLFERYFYFLEEQQSTGLLVLDETDRTDDRRFLSRVERYFSRHEAGKKHAGPIVPTPLFTASDMSYPIQAADIVIYLIAQGFRAGEMDAPTRTDFKAQWVEKVGALQVELTRSSRLGEVFTTRSIVYVSRPWHRRG